MPKKGLKKKKSKGSRYQGIYYPYKLNPIQKSGYPKLRDSDKNILVATSAGSGKTFFLEIAMALHENAVCTAPTKALVEQKYDSWNGANYGPFRGSLIVKTSDHPDLDINALRSHPFRLMTPEGFGSSVRNLKTNQWLREIQCICIDEIHSVGSEDERGHKLEAALVEFFQHFDCRIVGASATLPNAKEFGGWLTVLNGRETIVIESKWRPQPLKKHYMTYPYMEGSHFYNVNEKALVQKAVEVVTQRPTQKWLIFVHTKNSGWKIHKALEEEGLESDFHNADLDLKRRKILEERFTGDGLGILIATSTVAAGCNFPARNVIVGGVYRGRAEVNVRDMLQMAERAGRPGFDPKGDAYFLIPVTQEMTWVERLKNPPPVESQINTPPHLAFHIIAAIAKGHVQDTDGIYRWYEKTLAFYQGQQHPEIEGLLEYLITAGAIEEEEGRLTATKLGEAAANFYYDPLVTLAWYSNFMGIRRKFGIKATTNVRNIPLGVLAWALGNVPSDKFGYVPKDVAPFVDAHVLQVSQHGLSVTPERRMGVVATLMCLTDAEEIEDDDIPRPVKHSMSAIQIDAERTKAVLMYLNARLNMGLANVIDPLYYKMKYRIPWDGVELARVPNVGAVRARVLLKAHIRTPQDIVKYKKRVIGVLGINMGDLIHKSAKDLLAGRKKVSKKRSININIDGYEEKQKRKKKAAKKKRKKGK